MEDMIFCQRDIPKGKWRYGFRSSAVTGCGWIAVYNALRLLGYSPKPEELIKSFERQLPLIHGNIGTTILAPAFWMKRHGFQVEYLSRLDQFDIAAKRSDVCILFYHWRDKWKLGAHFVALRDTPEGFVGYNTYRNSKGPDRYGESLSVFLKKRKYFGAVLIGICDRQQKCRENHTL